MRAVFSLLGLVVVLALVGLLVKKQLMSTAAPSIAIPGAAATASAPAGTTVGQRSRQMQEDARRAVEGAMQQPRPMPEDTPSSPPPP